MNAAASEGEIDVQRETSASAPTLVLMQAPQEPRAVGGRPRADNASRSAWWRIHGTALMRFAFKRSLGDKNRAEDIVQEPSPRAERHLELVDGHVGPVGPIGQARTAMEVREALAQLRPEFRQVIVEMFYLGRSVTEIAQLLSIPESTVKSRSYYGVRQLKRLLSTRPRHRLVGRIQEDGS